MEGMRFVNSLSSLSFRTNGLMSHPTFRSPARGKVQPSKLPTSRGSSRGITPKLALEAIHTQSEAGFRERARFKTDIWTIRVKPLEIPFYFLESTTEVDVLVDKLIGLDKEKVRINGIEYDKMDAIERLMNLKVLLRREDLLRARIRMIAKAIKKEDWDDVKKLSTSLNLPTDVELLLLAAIAYVVTNGKPQRKIRKIADILYSPKNRSLFKVIMMTFAQYIRTIPPKKRASLKESLNIKEKMIGIVWDTIKKTYNKRVSVMGIMKS